MRSQVFQRSAQAPEAGPQQLSDVTRRAKRSPGGRASKQHSGTPAAEAGDEAPAEQAAEDDQADPMQPEAPSHIAVAGRAGRRAGWSWASGRPVIQLALRPDRSVGRCGGLGEACRTPMLVRCLAG
jgi:hypothetical protein